MTYSTPVKWEEAQAVIQQKMRDQPRGYQARLAKKLGKTPGFVNHLVTGDKSIPMDMLEDILSSLNLSYDVVLLELGAPNDNSAS